MEFLIQYFYLILALWTWNYIAAYILISIQAMGIFISFKVVVASGNVCVINFACRNDASERVLRCDRRDAGVGLQHSGNWSSAWWVQHTIVIDSFA